MTLKNISSKLGLLVMNNKEHNQVAREESIRNKENCHKLLLLSQKVRYVGIINNFGKMAVFVLSGHGIGADTCARILRNYTDDENLLKTIYEAEKQYVMTRGFWDN